MTRVVHISSVHPWDDERIYGRELGTLVRAGFDVHWIAVVPDDAEGSPTTRTGVTLHGLPRRSLSARLVASAGLVRTATSLDAALYHIHDPELLPAALSIGRRTGAPIVYDKHEYQRGRQGPKAAIITAVERSFAPRVDAVVVVEDGDFDGLDLDNVAVAWLPNYPRPAEFLETADLADRPDVSDADAPLRMVYSGVVARERGLWFMLDLVEELKSRGRDVMLDLVGICHRERERTMFEADVRRRGLEQEIRLTGWTRAVPWADLMHESARAHVGLMLMDPNYRTWSNIPTKFYEYLALGVPFVCTAYPTWQEFVERHGCGVAVNPLDASAAADGVLQAMNLNLSPDDVSSQYSWSNVEGNLIDLYRRLGVDAIKR